MFSPTYTITGVILARIKRITELILALNKRKFPHVVLMALEKAAREVSTHASTSIEGNPLPLTEVKKILKSAPAHIRQSEQEVLNYNHALEHVNDTLKKGKAALSLALICDMQRQITKGLLPNFESGVLRQKPVIVNDPATGRVIYVPPDVKDVGPRLTDLLAFTNEHRDQIDPLIVAGIFHKQMVLIHPFVDGNGRTARLATKVLLAEMGLNTFNLFSFENYYNKNVTRYFQMVGERGDYYDLAGTIDFTGWLEYFTEGIIDELLRVQKTLPNAAVSPQTALQSHHSKILSFIQKKGYIADRDYKKLVERSKASRALDFAKMIDLGHIKRKGKGKATYYILKEG